MKDTGDKQLETKSWTGAESLVQTFVETGLNVCFANPGTSEMHFVAALDTNPEMRCVLGLFEGVVTGAADGYGRMTGSPAATLTHLGPGLANGLANLHNAKKARTPMVNVIGDHATYHRKYDAPLTSDVEAVASPMSHWVKVSKSADDVARDGAEAVQASLKAPGNIASLILPADTAWNHTTKVAAKVPLSASCSIDGDMVRDSAEALLSGESSVILLNGVLLESVLQLAQKIASKTGARVMTDTFIPRLQRGSGRAEATRLPYFGEQAAEVLAGTKHLILVGTQPPVTFFAYPDKPNWLTPEGCVVHRLVEREGDMVGSLEALCSEVNANAQKIKVPKFIRPERPEGALTSETIGISLAHHFPENAIVIDEAGTSGAGCASSTRTSEPHDWLMLTGGAIGYGIPTATGAAVACPDRPVINLQADGAGMYTLQALWTQARENLNVTTIIFANQKYAILQLEFARVGAHNPGPKAMSMLDLSNPAVDWVSLAEGMGVSAWRASTLEEFNRALKAGLNLEGPALIEALL